MNSKNEITKKNIQLAYSQRNHTAYLTNIKTAAWYLTTQYPNIKPSNQQQQQQQKADDPKSEDKDNATTGTAGAHVQDTKTNKETTAPNGEASLGTHVSETSQATSTPPRTVGQILGAHSIDDTFWNNTNPTDVSIDTVNSEE